MATTLLRKLTLKSQLKFGKQYDKTVDNLLSLKQNTLLGWYYFNCSSISFIDEVLNEIGIGEDFRIEKPGKDEEKGKLWKKDYLDKLTYADKQYIYKSQRNGEKASVVARNVRDRIQTSKGVLRSKNQFK